jgi:type I restriction enzyme S subunit
VDELCEITSSKRIFAADYVSEGVPFYRGREITEKYKGNLDVSTELFITEEKFREIERKYGAPKQGDLLLTSVGTLGSVYVVKPDDRFYFKDGNLTWFRHFKELDSRFLYYWIGSPQGKAELQKCTIGSSQSAFTIVLLKSMEIALPPLPVQRWIASILSAYDELIENSQRRTKILEAMARAVYREWFVHDNLPAGLESETLKKSRFRDLCDLAKEPFSEELHADRPLLDLSRMPQYCLAPGETGAASELTTSRILFEPGDTLFGAIRCYLHKVNAAHFPGVTNTSVLVLRPKRLALRSLVAILASDTETIRWADTHSTGTKMPVINWGVFQTMPTLLPSEALAKAFEAIAGPMLDQIGVLATRIQNLRRTRDLLLPRLLSEQVEFEAA